MLKKIILATIKFYQSFISPGLGCNCRFYPSCSSYAVRAIKKYGALKGSRKSVWRILKCNPFNKGGVDLP
jgi:uncharacterized protein